MSFSRRTGLESEPVIQLGSMDADLRTALYNYLVDLFSDQVVGEGRPWFLQAGYRLPKCPNRVRRLHAQPR